MSASAVFFEPLMGSVPRSVCPPSMTSLSMVPCGKGETRLPGSRRRANEAPIRTGDRR